MTQKRSAREVADAAWKTVLSEYTTETEPQAMFLHAALAYAERGWAVLPLRTRSKVPLTAHGVKDATTDRTTIRDWWRRSPAANVGIATGSASGLLVVDVDPRHDGDEALRELERRYGPLPETVESLTGGGGRHLYFRCPAGLRSGKLSDGIDIKGEGGYVVAPPSIHDSGRQYIWEVTHTPDAVPLAEPPEWLLALLRKPARASGNGPAGRIPEGQRNTTLTSLAGSMRRRGMSQAAIEEALLAENAARCDPPLDAEEVLRIAASVARYAPGDAVVVASDEEELLTDLGNCKRFVAQHSDKLRYCAGLGWLAWDGRRWNRENGEALAMQCAKETALRLYDEAKAVLKQALNSVELAQEAAAAGETRGDQALAQLKAAQKVASRRLVWAEKSQSRQRLEAMLALAQSEDSIRVRTEDLDRDHGLLNTRNGTLDLRTGELREHRRDDLITLLAPVDFDPDAVPTAWLRHLETVLPDPEVRRQVQRDLGLALVGANLEQILPIWYGVGANGKSTTLRVLQMLLGDYAQMAAPRLLMKTKYERHPTELAELRGRRLVFSVETAEGGRLDEERVKMLTGGERIRGRFMRQDFIEFDPSWTIILVTNHKPVITGDDQGIWRRIRLIPWTVALPRERQRPQEAVVSELLAEGGAILAWMLAGLQDWLRERTWVAPSVQVATETYHGEQDIIGAFLADWCELDDAYTVAVGELYDAYERWSALTGEAPLTKTSFSKRLADRGFVKARRPDAKGTRVWRGLRLKIGGH